jgi:hypothetical protein
MIMLKDAPDINDHALVNIWSYYFKMDQVWYRAFYLLTLTDRPGATIDSCNDFYPRIKLKVFPFYLSDLTGTVLLGQDCTTTLGAIYSVLSYHGCIHLPRALAIQILTVPTRPIKQYTANLISLNSYCSLNLNSLHQIPRWNAWENREWWQHI